MKADVCFVVEGSYPYVTGGVASWVHQVISNLPEVRFALLTLLADDKASRVDKYQVPSNVVARQDVFLFGELRDTGDRREANRETIEAIRTLHETPNGARCPFFRSTEALLRLNKQSAVTLFTAKSSWRLMRRLYEDRDRHVSFLDYFWTWRAIHGPMFRMLGAPLPEAAVYHPVSTGYAGLLAGLAKIRHGSGIVLTEHGLYTREREIEIAHADWIYREPPPGTFYVPHEPFFKGWWGNLYRFLGQLTYDMADTIVTLHEANRQIQIAAGAAPEKLVIVPNGIDPEPYASARVERSWRDRPMRIGLIGRVVPIKDVKTFIRAVHIAGMTSPIEAYVLGPTDEDPDYFRECQELVALLGLGEVLTFAGKVNVKEWLAKLDLNILTSVSESQPLVILEAAAAGVPTVATNVGACREMLEGKPGEDALLGPSGLVTPVVSPGATAAAILDLYQDPTRHAEMVRAGLARLNRFYRQDLVFDYYRKLYRELAARSVEVG